MHLYHPWRVGFEVEVVLGDLGDRRFVGFDEPMDVAYPVYCQAVASALRSHTGLPWTAPKTTPRKPGFYVFSEYDLDPLDWPRDLLGGVELVTPPLLVDEAERVRHAIIDAIFALDGHYNFSRNIATERCAWHINVDPGQEEGARLDPANLILGVDELAALHKQDRLWSKYAAPQHHAYGPPLLRLLRSGTDMGLIEIGLGNLLTANAGYGKRYAANLDKLSSGYLELRYFNAETFFGDDALSELLYPFLDPLEMWASEHTQNERALLARYKMLSEWAHSARNDISWSAEIGKYALIGFGPVRFKGEEIGRIVINGEAEITLSGRGRRTELAIIRDVLPADVAEGVAILAFDLALLQNMCARPGKSVSMQFQDEVDGIARLLKASEMRMPGPQHEFRRL